MTAEEVRALLERQPRPVCADLTPFTLVDIDPDRGFARCRFHEQPAFGNHFGNVQGGFAVAMLDVVITCAAFAKLRGWLPTIEIKTTFLEPLPIGETIGEAHVIKVGKSLAFVEAQLLLADGRPAVTATTTLLVPARS